MLEDLQCGCDAPGCQRTFGARQLQIRTRTDAGERRGYQCACGAVTVTLVEQLS